MNLKTSRGPFRQLATQVSIVGTIFDLKTQNNKLQFFEVGYFEGLY